MARLARFYKPLLVLSLVFLVFACGGGGCSGCEGCGIRPIPGAFPLDARIPNAAQVRLTSSGIEFIEANIDPIVASFLADGLEFPVPETSGSQTILIITMRYTVCPAGRMPPCVVHAEISDLELTPTTPNRLHAVIQLRLWSTDGAGGVAPLFVDTNLGDLNVTLDTRNGSRDFVAFETDITFATETEPARSGYTRIDVGSITPVAGQDIENDDIDISSGGGIGGGFLSFIANLLKGTIVGLLRDQLGGLTDGLVGDNLCTQAGEFGCPTGTFADGPDATAICRFGTAADSRCVPMLLGTDGRGDLGEAFLGGFSPGAHAPVQFVLGAGGDGEAVDNGMSLFMIGGFQSWNREFTTTPGHNACVPIIEPPPLPTIARASAFRGNVIPGTATETHLGIGLAEDYLNYAGYGMFDSGALCIGTGTRLSQQLSTGLVSALVRSLTSLAFPIEDAPLAIALRPQRAPTFEIGTASGAPLLTVTLPQLQMDFYVWSTERYVRFMTYQADLAIQINLVVEGGQIVPQIVGITPSNSSVSNNELLNENPMMIATALETVIAMFADMFASGLSGFDLPEIMGFNLTVPDGGITGVDSDGERFLGIFANLSLAAPMPLTAPVESSLEVSDLVIDRESMSLESWGAGRNTAWLYFDAEGPAGVDYEYSYRIDGTHWRPWTRDRRVQIDDEALLLQARHTIEARARIVGEYLSVDATPASVDVLIDILEPTLEVEPAEAGWIIRGRDVVSSRDGLEARYRLADGEWSEWTALVDGELMVPNSATDELADGASLGVELRDEAGNVASTTLPLIRGIANPSVMGSCACRVNSPARQPGIIGAVMAGLLALLFGTRRARKTPRKERAPRGRTFRGVRLLLGALFTLGLSVLVLGCDCGGTMRENCGDECLPHSGTSTVGSVCCMMSDMCVDYDANMLCMPGFTCAAANVTINSRTCEVTCSMCTARPPLVPGLLATDLDFVSTPMGDMVSGYSPGNPPSTRYGDLVFGEVLPSGMVEWEIVDGAPTSPITADPGGWRGGVAAAGNDVGRWTSMVDGGGRTYIAYYDATNGDLKIAVGAPMAWSIHTIDSVGDSGRYASLVLTSGGIPAVSYLRIERQADGTVRSGVRVAVANSAMPDAPADWTIAEVSGAATPCRGSDCNMGEVCLDTGSCVMGGTCTPACSANDEVCSGGMCVAGFSRDYVEDIAPRHGMYTQLVATMAGLALVWYDRTTGNLWGASAAGTTFGAPFLIDGYMRAGGGDAGLGSSLFVDTAGTWHVTYVNGAEEELWYAQVSAGTVTLRERIDDGSTDGMMRHPDGRHIIGDDSSVVVLTSGEVRVAYQDATAARTMLARRTAAGTWSVSIIDDMDASGFWVEQVVTGGGTGSTVASFWRRTMMGNPNGVRVTEVP